MLTPTHMISASVLALIYAQVAPTETGYILASLAFSGLLDLDHIYYLIRDRKMYQEKGLVGQLHHARSPLHELPGVILLGVIALVIHTFDQTLSSIFFLSVLIHLSEDFFAGIAFPFNPFDKTEMALFKHTKMGKLIINALVIIVSGVIWVLYLQGKL